MKYDTNTFFILPEGLFIFLFLCGIFLVHNIILNYKGLVLEKKSAYYSYLIIYIPSVR